MGKIPDIASEYFSVSDQEGLEVLEQRQKSDDAAMDEDDDNELFGDDDDDDNKVSSMHAIII
jgi:hypothetical protein